MEREGGKNDARIYFSNPLFSLSSFSAMMKMYQKKRKKKNGGWL